MMVGVDEIDNNRLVTIGEFARSARLTSKALRVYEEQGILRPIMVDASTGYRRYSLDQVREARLIGLLRSVDMSLADIRGLLGAQTECPEQAVDRLDRHLDNLENRHDSRRVLIRHIQAVLREEQPAM